MVETSKLNLRLPVTLREDAAYVAAMQGLSLNAFIVQAVANWTGYHAQRLAKVPRASQMVAASPPVQASTTVARRVVSDPLDRPIRNGPKVGPNEPCPCGSGQKYKRCHGKP